MAENPDPNQSPDTTPAANPSSTATAQPTDWSNASAYTDQNKYNSIVGWYRKYLGRDPDTAGFNQYYFSNQTPQQIQQAISQSAEAGWYQGAGAPAYTGSSRSGSSGGTDPNLDKLNSLLAQYPNDPQKAIDAYNALGLSNDTLKPAWYPDSKTIGLANGSYLVQPGTGGNTGTGWQTVQRGNESSGSSFSNFNLTPAPTFNPASLPTMDQVTNTPGFQFAKEQGLEGLQRGAAAGGSAISGGLGKDMANYSSGLASTYYQNAVNNALNVNQQNNSGSLANWATQNGLGLNAFGANLGAQNQFFNQYNTNQNAAFMQWLALAQLGNPGNPYA